MVLSEDALKSRLRSIAAAAGLTSNEVLHKLVMERFLVRVGASPHRSHLVFKGGFLLSHYVAMGRGTRDLDFLFQKPSLDRPLVTRLLTEVAAQNQGDGFVFILKSVEDLLHTHMASPGFRAQCSVHFGKIKETLDLDMGVGDVVIPRDERVSLMSDQGKALFEQGVSLLSYPPETIFAEKLQTAAIRGPLNSRMKDYYDLWFLLESGQLSLETLKAAITATFAHRKTPLDTLPLAFSDSEIQTLQSYWSAFLRGLKSKEGIPLFVKVVIERLNGEMTRLGIGTV